MMDYRIHLHWKISNWSSFVFVFVFLPRLAFGLSSFEVAFTAARRGSEMSLKKSGNEVMCSAVSIMLGD
ncbi:hypothetical protein GO003_012225 [Methylicorpusculum oleiharenae]|uniref:hypothetical protein n=1 Tax=Methylicorpusculum oleiharenae TaxID=1338687 RepID=UPI001356F06A|nr:hypothetical protein [Methylicorpusculum oleiharenae]MCD2451158.1 hypothetical protein [Methylicorpusculum oleiharenae]